MSLVVRKGGRTWTLFTHIPSRALNATVIRSVGKKRSLSKMSFWPKRADQNGCFTSKLTTCLTWLDRNKKMVTGKWSRPLSDHFFLPLLNSYALVKNESKIWMNSVFRSRRLKLPIGIYPIINALLQTLFKEFFVIQRHLLEFFRTILSDCIYRYRCIMNDQSAAYPWLI